MKEITPEQILSKGKQQILRSEQIDKILRNAGFRKTRETGSTHTHYIHDGSGVTTGSHHQPESLIYQKNAAKAIIEAGKQIEELRKAHEEILQNAFNRMAMRERTSDLKPAQEILSQDGFVVLTSNDYNDVCVVRDREYPQLAMLAHAVISEDQAKAIKATLSTQKKEFLFQLERMKAALDYDITQSKDGTLHLRHKVYGDDVSWDLPPHNPGGNSFAVPGEPDADWIDQFTLLEIIEKEISEIDSSLQLYTQQIIEEAVEHDVEFAEQGNGTRVWQIPVKHFLTLEEKHIPLETTTNFRPSPESMIHFLNEFFKFQEDYSINKPFLENAFPGIIVTLDRAKKGNPQQIHGRLPGRSVSSFHINTGYVPPSDQADPVDACIEKLDILGEWPTTKNEIKRNISKVLEPQTKLLGLIQHLISQQEERGGIVHIAMAQRSLNRGDTGTLEISPRLHKKTGIMDTMKIRFFCPKNVQITTRFPIMEFAKNILPYPQDVDTLEQAMIKAGTIPDPAAVQTLEVEKPALETLDM